MAEKDLEIRRVNVRLTPDLYERFANTAKQRGFSLQAMAVIAIESYIEQHEKQKRD